MCGIVGVISEKGVKLSDFLTVLHGLQHRGQESAGFVGYTKDGELITFKTFGLVSQILEKFGENPTVKILIGHTRYSTTGESWRHENIQPFFVLREDGITAIVHNGNIRNYNEIKEGLSSKGVFFRSTSDTEAILNLYITLKGEAEDRFREMAEVLRGAWTVLLIEGKNLFAVRDPYGFRPLWMGRRNGEVWFASEDSALISAGVVPIKEIDRGMGVKASFSGISEFTVGEKTPLPCSFELVYFARPDSNIFGKSVYKWRYFAGEKLAEVEDVDADIVVPVPDSGNIYALGFSKKLGKPLHFGLIRSHYAGRSFIQPTQEKRKSTVKMKLFPVISVLKGRSIYLIDDSIVRGTTMREIVRMIREAGAREVHVRIGSPPVIGPCYYGIDTPNRKELIANQMDVEGIRKFIEADTLKYLPLEVFRDFLRNFCISCFSGNYEV
ncbi:MAG: amidophosphoribosyltransferase [candidate division WOR-3 bacterium]